MGDEGLRGGQGEVAAGADAEDAVGRLDHVAGAGDEQRVLGVDDGDHRFEPAQRAVGPPFLGQLGGGPRHVGRVVFQLGLEAFEQGEGVGGAAGEAGEHAAVGQRANLHGVGLHHRVAEAHLAVAADGDAAVVADGENRRGAELFRVLHEAAILCIAACKLPGAEFAWQWPCETFAKLLV